MVQDLGDACAFDIAEDLLRRTGEALATGDFDMYAACFRLPQPIETFESSFVIETRDDLRRVFRDVRDTLEQLAVDENSRRIIDAQFHDPETIMTTHETRLISRGVIVQEAFPVLSTIKLIDDAWVIARGSYALPDSRDSTHRLVGKIVKGVLRDK